MKKVFAVLFLIVVGMQTALAQQSLLRQDRLYLGGGISSNDSGVSFLDDGTGFQFFGGYDLPVKISGAKLAVEVGYWDSGDFDPAGSADGLWANGVISLHLSRDVDLLGRAGFDFGDDDGFMIGIGIGVKMNRQIELRGEFVQRDETDSLQFNIAYHL
jgi:hypothetical protein